MKDSGIKVGQRYGKLEVVKQDGVSGKEKAWIVKCDCGNEERVASYYLKKEKRACKKCSRIKDISNKRFGNLTAIKPIGTAKNRSAVWLCKCDCGNQCEYTQKNLVSGNSKSCGKCGLREKNLAIALSKHNLKACIDGSKYDQIKEDRKPNKNNNTSNVKGVWFDKNRKKYVSELRFQRQKVFMKRFDTIEEAIEARKEAEKKYFEPIREEYCRRNQVEV